MKKLNLIICVAWVLFVTSSCMKDNDNDIPDAVSATDRTFILNAADGGMFEVKAGELAVTKGDTARYVIHASPTSVRTYGQMMITDHTKANEELKTLADRKQVAIPATLSAAKQQKIDSLSSASGAAFNTMYTKMMVVSHQETIALFEAESSIGDDNEIKSFASGKLPTLKHHLDMAVMMRESIK
ncbi:DUF4142 domain-containing protein [Dyadobacter sp. CY312]|uniref:DUF4142 domain-containing protein n=1 Tax=Dyadobacter sp. CY312 TaxID=2907303 RepID=UPI001F373A33|nr:DUF4142 domain-containing protein [Dyadobacter sp. CY312]MCE7042858.1 DUF4142 domain-containing protein [Dyadobacter sp. CY312]